MTDVGSLLVGAKGALYALDLLSGQNIWETEKLKGATVAVAPVYEKDLVLLVTVENNSANKAKPRITALRMTTGELAWEADYPDNVDLYGIERGSKYFPKFDLSGANPPLYDADSVYLTYAGLHRYSLEDGRLLWGAKYDVAEGSIKRGNAQAVIDGDTIYTSARGQLRAIDKATGAVKWVGKDFGGAVAELKLNGDVIYGRLGAAGTAAKVAKFGFGGLGAIGKGGGDERDEPVALYRRENGTVVVAGKRHLLAFDPRARRIVWSVKYEAPRPPPRRRRTDARRVAGEEEGRKDEG